MNHSEDCIEQLYALYLSSRGVCTDSRRVRSGSLFFALRGDQFDGNLYAQAALEAGAAYAVVDDPHVVCSERYFCVEDTLKSLQALAAYHRRQLGIPILAITGSNGKTTTKELISRVLRVKFRVAVTEANLNNHIGVPLTLLEMDRTVEFGIVEMGANHRGEIADLCTIAQPNYGLITNVGRAHLEGFGGEEGVRKGKGELYDYLSAHDGMAFYLQENEILREMIAERPLLKNESYSECALSQIESDPKSGFLALTYRGLLIQTALVGDYNRFNVLASLAIGAYFGVMSERAVAAVSAYLPDNNRSQRMDTGRNTLFVDAYNANPSSMHAALNTFSAGSTTSDSNVVILGEMRELGVYAEAEHRAVIEYLHRNGLTRGFLVGPHFCALLQAELAPNSTLVSACENSTITLPDENSELLAHDVASQEHGLLAHDVASQEHGLLAFADTSALVHYLEKHPLRGCRILLKGSRGNRLEQLIDLL